MAHGPDSVDACRPDPPAPSGPPSSKSGTPPAKDRRPRKLPPLGSRLPRRLAPTGRTTIPSAASTPSSATRPGTVSSCKRSNGLPPVLLNCPCPHRCRPPPRHQATARPGRSAGGRIRRRQAARRPPRTADTRLRATTRCWAEATSTSTPSSSSVPCVWSNRTASSACSRPPASTPTRPPPASSNPSPPAAASVASSTSKTPPGNRFAAFLSQMFDSRFKFCALIFGGEERRFDGNRMCLLPARHRRHPRPGSLLPPGPSDFARVNPNTGTAPVFRTRRDADITRRIYERHPVLVDRSGDEEVRAWPVRYLRMFDMTNDSHLFRTAAQLDADGFYPVQGNRWKKGEELYLPLYEGKHDSGSSTPRCKCQRNRQPRESEPYFASETPDEHADPNWFCLIRQFWVPHKMQKVRTQLGNP